MKLVILIINFFSQEQPGSGTIQADDRRIHRHRRADSLPGGGRGNRRIPEGQHHHR